MRPKILVDADACPVIDIIIKVAKQFRLETFLFCDTSHNIERDGAKTIIVAKGTDATDFTLLNEVTQGDIVITQDYGLAALALVKQAYVMNQNGIEFTPENIQQFLELRNMSQKIRKSGGKWKGAKKRKKADDERFLSHLIKLCKKAINKQ